MLRLRRTTILISGLIILSISLVGATALFASNLVMSGWGSSQDPNAAMLQQRVTERCNESQQWDEPKPGYEWINQSKELHGVTIRLLQGKFTDTGTTLEFLIEYPFQEGVPDFPARFRLWSVRDSVEGINSVSNAHFSSTWGCGGRLLAVLDGLGPVADTQQGFSIQVPKVLKRTDPASGTQGEGTWETIEGPWTFQVSPVESTGTSQTFDVNQSLEHGGITLKLQRVVLGSDETLVYYDEVVNPPVMTSHLGRSARIRYGAGAWMEGQGGGTPSREGEPSVYRFPALPSGVGSFELDFGPFLASTDSGLEMTIGLPSGTGGALPLELPLNQEIQTSEGIFKAVSLSIEDTTGFSITLEPVDGGTKNIMLHPGPFDLAHATDDLGNVYGYDGGSARTVEEDGAALGLQEISFQGELPAEATELTLQFENFWKVQPGPWVFEVEVPDNG